MRFVVFLFYAIFISNRFNIKLSKDENTAK